MFQKPLLKKDAAPGGGNSNPAPAGGPPIEPPGQSNKPAPKAKKVPPPTFGTADDARTIAAIAAQIAYSQYAPPGSDVVVAAAELYNNSRVVVGQPPISLQLDDLESWVEDGTLLE